MAGLEVVGLVGHNLKLKRVDGACESPEVHVPVAWCGRVASENELLGYF